MAFRGERRKKRDKFRGGRRKKRDKWYGLDKYKCFEEFKHWYHRIEKIKGALDMTLEEVKREYEAWKSEGCPKAK